jgi:hypothetical protein
LYLTSIAFADGKNRSKGLASSVWISAGRISSWPSFPASPFSRLFGSTSSRPRPPSSPSERLAKLQTSSSPSSPSLPPQLRFFGLFPVFFFDAFFAIDFFAPFTTFLAAFFSVCFGDAFDDLLIDLTAFFTGAGVFLAAALRSLGNCLDRGFSQCACCGSDQVRDLFA